MIQVIEAAAPKRNMWGEVGSQLAGGIAEGYEKSQEKKKQAAQLSQENEAIKKNYGIDLSGIKNPETRKIIISEQLKSQGKQNEYKTGLSFFDKINQEKKSAGQETEPSKKYSEDEILATSFVKPAAATQMRKHNENIDKKEKTDLEKSSSQFLLEEAGYEPEEATDLSKKIDYNTAKTLHQNKKGKGQYEPEAQKLAAQRTNKFIDSSEAAGKASDEKLRGIEEGMALHKQGATGFKLTNYLAEKFDIPSLADPASKGFNAAMKSQYHGIADIVKGKVSNFEFATFEKRIATAADSPQAAEILMISSAMESQISRKQRDIVNEKRMQYYEKGEEPPPNFDIEVLRELQPYADLILHQTNEKINNVLNPTSKTNVINEKASQIWGS